MRNSTTKSLLTSPQLAFTMMAITLLAFTVTALFPMAAEATSTRGSASVRLTTQDQLGGLAKRSDLLFQSPAPLQLASAQPEFTQLGARNLLESEPARFTLPGADDKHFTLSLPEDGTVYVECVSHGCAGERIAAQTFHQDWVEEKTGPATRTQRFMEIHSELEMSEGGITGNFQGTFEMILHYE